MWQQTTIGKYTNGTDHLCMQLIGSGKTVLWKNEDYEKEFSSYDELNDYLMHLGLEHFYVPKIALPDNVWRCFSGDEHYQEIYTRKKENGDVQSVVVCQYKTGDYAVFSRENNYKEMGYFLETAMDFAEALQRNPKDDVELDAYEVSTHGASGMDEHHFNVKNYEEVQRILRDVYSIITA